MVNIDRGGLIKGDQSSLNQYLIFRLGCDLFAIDILNIREIIEYSTVTEVPLMPSFLKGVINLRGAVVPVIDLSIRFGRAASVLSVNSCVVILEVLYESDIQLIGVLVDSVSQVVDIPLSDIEPPPSFGSMLRPDFIGGMGKFGGKFVIILNVAHVLSIDDMAGFENILEK